MKRSRKTYSKDSWIDPRIEIRKSRTGKGMFATRLIKKGEVVMIWGGTIFTDEEKKKGLVKKYTASCISEGLWLGSPAGSADTDDIFLNHSCDPNLWMKDEEITADYAMWLMDKEWIMEETCKCGSPLCRKRITGNDWKLKALQKRYKGHFAPFINKRIKKLS